MNKEIHTIPSYFLARGATQWKSVPFGVIQFSVRVWLLGNKPFSSCIFDYWSWVKFVRVKLRCFREFNVLGMISNRIYKSFDGVFNVIDKSVKELTRVKNSWIIFTYPSSVILFIFFLPAAVLSSSKLTSDIPFVSIPLRISPKPFSLRLLSPNCKFKLWFICKHSRAYFSFCAPDFLNMPKIPFPSPIAYPAIFNSNSSTWTLYPFLYPLTNTSTSEIELAEKLIFLSFLSVTSIVSIAALALSSISLICSEPIWS